MNTTPSQAKGETAGEEKPSAETPATREQHELFHKAWSNAAAGVYDKSIWKDLQATLAPAQDQPAATEEKMKCTHPPENRCSMCSAIANPESEGAAKPLGQAALDVLRYFLNRESSKLSCDSRSHDREAIDILRGAVADVEELMRTKVKHIESDVFKTGDHEPLPFIENCPHCGSDRISPQNQPDTLEGRPICFAECNQCGAQGPPADSTEAALEKWNERVPQIPGGSYADKGISVEAQAAPASSLSTTPKATSEDTVFMNWIENHARWTDDKNSVRIVFPMETVMFCTLRQAINAAMEQSAPHQPVGEEGEAKGL